MGRFIQKIRDLIVFYRSFVRKARNFFELVEVKIAIKMAITAFLSYYLCVEVSRYLEHPTDLTAGLWCVMAAIVVLQNSIGGTYKAIWNRFLGVLIGSAVGACFAFWLGTEIEILGLAIFLTVTTCSLFGLQGSYRIASLSVAIIMIPWKSHPTGSPWTYAFFRFLDTCLGFAVAIVVSHLIWPSQALTSMRQNMAEIFTLFRQLIDSVLNFNQVSKKTNKIAESLSVEIGERFQKNRQVFEESKIELIMQSRVLEIWSELIDGQEKLLEHVETIQKVYSPQFETIFDESLKSQLKNVIEGIDSALKELSLKLRIKKTAFDFQILRQLQHSLTEELIRFRSTRTIKKYDLSTVEDYYVFFFQIKQILIILENFNKLFDAIGNAESEESV